MKTRLSVENPCQSVLKAPRRFDYVRKLLCTAYQFLVLLLNQTCIIMINPLLDVYDKNKVSSDHQWFAQICVFDLQSFYPLRNKGHMNSLHVDRSLPGNGSVGGNYLCNAGLRIVIQGACL